MSDTVVTILCICYNQEKYIADALESFVKQKTTFPFEIFVGDDCSTDGTVEIVKKYQKKYRNIKLFEHQKNIGVCANFFELADKVKSQYVALCEGDDYWIDNLKLEKQVKALERHPDVTLCFHTVKVLEQEKEVELFPSDKMIKGKTLNLNLLKQYNFIQTNSVVYKWQFSKFKEKLRGVDMLPLDYIYHLYHASYGNILYLEEAMSVYRCNCGGVWSNIWSPKWFDRNAVRYLTYLKFMSKEFNKSDEVLTALFKNIIKYRKLDNNQDLSDTLSDKELHKFENNLYAKYKFFGLKLCRKLTFGKVKKKNILSNAIKSTSKSMN